MDIAAGRPHLVVIGNGMMGMRTVDELLRRDPGRYRVTVLGAEPHPAYNRILLSGVLAGEQAAAEIVTHSHEWYAANGIRLIAGDRASAIDRAARSVTTASGEVLGWDALLLATGSRPLAPPIPGIGLAGVTAFRDLGDVDRMLAASEPGRRAVVIGGGLLGLEAAWGLARRGMAVTVLHLMPTLMERQLDDAAGAMLERDLVRRGLAVMTPAQTEAILGEHHVEAVQLADGRILPADLVVLAIGVRPEIALARDAGLKVGRGVMVFDDMRTSDPAILAVGECAEHRGQAHGLVAPLWEQARVAAATLAGEAAAYAPPAFATSLKITGIDLYSAGVLAAADTDDEEVVLRDEARGHYRKLVLRQGRLIGAVLYGDVGEGPWFLRLIESGEPIGGRRHALVFGQALAEAA